MERAEAGARVQRLINRRESSQARGPALPALFVPVAGTKPCALLTACPGMSESVPPTKPYTENRAQRLEQYLAAFCASRSFGRDGSGRRKARNCATSGASRAGDADGVTGGGPTGNRTRVQGFAVLCVTTPPSGPDESEAARCGGAEPLSTVAAAIRADHGASSGCGLAEAWSRDTSRLSNMCIARLKQLCNRVAQ